MITGRTPEITIKFNEKPNLPTEGKKVTFQVEGQNGIKVKAQMNRKTLKKQVEKMEQYPSWLGALSGKIQGISTEGIIELASARLQVFEVKPKQGEATAESGKNGKGVSSKSASSSQKNKQQPQSQTVDKQQLEKEAKLQKLIASATSPRDKAFYQELLKKTRAEYADSLAKKSLSVEPDEEEKAQAQQEIKSDTQKDQTDSVIFQAVGLIQAKVELNGDKLEVLMGESSYPLKFVPGYKRKHFEALKKEIEEKGSCLKTLLVYPQSRIKKKEKIVISFALSTVPSSESGNSFDLGEREFKLCGFWQYPRLNNTPCITIRRNWEQGLVSRVSARKMKL